MLVEHDQIRALTGGDRAGDLVEPIHLGDVDRVAGDRFLKTYSFVGQQWPGARIAGGPAGHRNLYPFQRIGAVPPPVGPIGQLAAPTHTPPTRLHDLPPLTPP